MPISNRNKNISDIFDPNARAQRATSSGAIALVKIELATPVDAAGNMVDKRVPGGYSFSDGRPLTSVVSPLLSRVVAWGKYGT